MHRRAARRIIRGSRATCIGGLCADVRSWLSAEGFAAFVRTNVRLWEEYDARDATRRIQHGTGPVQRATLRSLRVRVERCIVGRVGRVLQHEYIPHAYI